MGTHITTAAAAVTVFAAIATSAVIIHAPSHDRAPVLTVAPSTTAAPVSTDVSRRGDPAASDAPGGSAATGERCMGGADTPPVQTNDDNDHLCVFGEVAVPAGVAGIIDVVMYTTGDDASLPIIVRNNTDTTVYEVQVTSSARSSDGTLIATGQSLGGEPSVLEPGEWGMSFLYFDTGGLTGDERYEFEATAQNDAGFVERVPLVVQEVSSRPGANTRIVGIVRNDSDTEVNGPSSLTVACFDATGSLVAVESGSTERNKIGSGGSAPFTLAFFDEVDCSAFAIAASGYNF